MENIETKENWKMYVAVFSKQQAVKDAARVRKWCDKTKIVENRGLHEVWMLNPSAAASAILGL